MTEYNLVPLLPKYFEQCLSLMALQFSKDNSIDSPVHIGLKISQDEFMKRQRSFLQQLINSPICALLVNPKNDDIIAMLLMLPHKKPPKNSNSNSKKPDAELDSTQMLTQTLSHKKLLMDKYLESKIACSENKKLYYKLFNHEYDHDADTNTNTSNMKVAIDGHGCTNPKYALNGKGTQMGAIVMFYQSYLLIRNNYEYGLGIIANEYSYRGCSKFYDTSFIVASKVLYSELFDYLNIKYKNNQIKGLKDAIKLHPYRYLVILHFMEKNFKRKVEQFIQQPQHKKQIENFDKMRKQYCMSRL